VVVGTGYGQFCPVALASETLAQRWMLLIVRELCAGATRFSEIRRGVPGISASLLKQRLDVLERAGVVRRPRTRSGTTPAYVLTAAGEELRPVMASIGAWGQRWARGIRDEDLDAGWLVWAMHRRLDTRALPRGRTVIELDFTDAPSQRRTFWLVCNDGAVDVCLKPPGFDTDLTVTTSVRTLAEIWRGLRRMGTEMKAGRLRLEGEGRLRRAFPSSLLLSAFAPIERRRTDPPARFGKV
jgi:DNA-binding HxlR family transcriptional regulator